MISKFKLSLPQTVAEACRLLEKMGPYAKVVAGGTDLFVEMHNGQHRPEHIIDLKTIPDLKGILGDEKTGLDIGAMVTHHEIETNQIILKHYPILVEGVKTIGSLQVRNRATIGGNLCTGAPSADGIGPLLVLNAVCSVEGPAGRREIPLADFFIGPKKTVLRAGEILMRIIVPPMNGKSGSAYFKYGRRKAMEIALMGVSVYLETEPDGVTCHEARIALATSAPTPIRVPGAEKYLMGKNLSDHQVLATAGCQVLEEARPRTSWRSSEEFRLTLLKKLVPETIRRAYQNLNEGEGCAKSEN